MGELGNGSFPRWSRGENGALVCEGLPAGYYYSANFGTAENPTKNYPDGQGWYRKAVYAADGSGIERDHNSDWEHWGDTLLLVGHEASIKKSLLQKTGRADKAVFDLDRGQRVVEFLLQPSVTYANPNLDANGEVSETTVVVRDVLPEHLTYVGGSARLGYDGRYFDGPPSGGNEGTVMDYAQAYPAGGTQGVVTGGEPSEPAVSGDGKTLTWTLENVKIGKDVAIPAIYYAAAIGDRGDPGRDVPEGSTDIENTAYIYTDCDTRDPTVENGKVSKAGITVTRGEASGYGKYTRQGAVDVDGEIDYVVYYNNNSEAEIRDVAFMDTMPSDGASLSSFAGTYEILGWDVGAAGADLSGVSVWYTDSGEYADKTMKDLREEYPGMSAESGIPGWTKAAMDGGRIGIPDGPVTAWVAFVDSIGPGGRVDVNMKIGLKPDYEKIAEGYEGVYVNRMSVGDDTPVNSITRTVARSLEGRAWMDYDWNGVQDEGEPGIDGIRVELLKLRPGGDPEKEDDYKIVENAAVPTGYRFNLTTEAITEYSAGRYRFDSLEAGTYAVRFTDGGDGRFGPWKGTKVRVRNNGQGDEANDSDAVPVYASDLLDHGIILGIVMKDAEQLYEEGVRTQDEKHWDAGFCVESKFRIDKTDGAGRPLAGASFRISTWPDGEPVNFAGAEGQYLIDGSSQDVGLCYIQLARDEDFVLTMRGTGNGSKAVLDRKGASDWQMFERIGLDDGSVAFALYGTDEEYDGYIDLDEGNPSDETIIHLWRNAGPNENQRWVLHDLGDGKVGIQAWRNRNGDHSWLDLDSNEVQPGQTIWAYTKNGTSAQEWRLVPVSTDILPCGADGRLSVENLWPGEYEVSEARTPVGYMDLDGPVRIRIGTDGTVGVWDGAVYKPLMEGEALEIVNVQLFELPRTGGAGTGAYIAIGSTMVLLSGLLLFRRKQRG